MTEKNTSIKEKEELRQGEDQSPELQIPRVDQAKEEAHQAAELDAARREVDKQSTTIEKEDKVLENLKVEQSSEVKDRDDSQRPANADLRKITFKKEIKHIQRKLNKGDRLGSRIIHQPIIKNVSEVSAKTITRPSGLLGGGITAFLGTSIYLYLTKHIGLKYNYSMFLFLLIAGFILGVLIEALIRLTRGRKAV